MSDHAELPQPTPRPAMPPEIAKAIVKVMAQIKTLSKDERNAFQKYDYVSVDQFYAEVGRLMAGAGIFTVAFEASMEVSKRATTTDRGDTKESMWLTALYDIFVYHETGASYGPVSRSMTVPASGAQSYASALSFVEKYFLRSLFKIPTGDGGDPDGGDKRPLPSGPQEPERNIDDERKEAEAQTTRDHALFLARSLKDWESIKSQASMKVWWTSMKETMGGIYPSNDHPLYQALKASYQEAGKKLPPEEPKAKPAEVDAPKSDEIPFASGDAKPRPSLSVLRLNFGDALRENARTEAEANLIYADVIEPHEKTMTTDEINGFVRQLRSHVSSLK